MTNWSNNFVQYFEKHIKWLDDHGQLANSHAAMLQAQNQAPHPAAMDPSNVRKNRFSEVLPGEDTMVPGGDGGYINADYINAR